MSEKAVSIWVKAEPFSYGTIPVAPHPRLNSTVGYHLDLDLDLDSRLDLDLNSCRSRSRYRYSHTTKTTNIVETKIL